MEAAFNFFEQFEQNRGLETALPRSSLQLGAGEDKEENGPRQFLRSQRGRILYGKEGLLVPPMRALPAWATSLWRCGRCFGLPGGSNQCGEASLFSEDSLTSADVTIQDYGITTPDREGQDVPAAFQRQLWDCDEPGNDENFSPGVSADSWEDFAAELREGGQVCGARAAYFTAGLDHRTSLEESILDYKCKEQGPRECSAWVDSQVVTVQDCVAGVPCIAKPPQASSQCVQRDPLECSAFADSQVATVQDFAVGVPFSTMLPQVPPQGMQHEPLKCSAYADSQVSTFQDFAAGAPSIAVTSQVPSPDVQQDLSRCTVPPHVVRHEPLQCSAFAGSQVWTSQDAAAGVSYIARTPHVPPQGMQHTRLGSKACANNHVLTCQDCVVSFQDFDVGLTASECNACADRQGATVQDSATGPAFNDSGHEQRDSQDLGSGRRICHFDLEHDDWQLLPVAGACCASIEACPEPGRRARSSLPGPHESAGESRVQLTGEAPKCPLPAPLGFSPPVPCSSMVQCAEGCQVRHNSLPIGFRIPDLCVQETHADRQEQLVPGEGAMCSCLSPGSETLYGACSPPSPSGFRPRSPCVPADETWALRTGDAPRCLHHVFLGVSPPVPCLPKMLCADSRQVHRSTLPVGFRIPNPCVQETQAGRQEQLAPCEGAVPSCLRPDSFGFRPLLPCSRQGAKASAEAGEDADAGVSACASCALQAAQVHKLSQAGASVRPGGSSQLCVCHCHAHFPFHSPFVRDRDAVGGEERPYSPDISTAACPGPCNVHINCDSSRMQPCQFGLEACGREWRDCPETSMASDHHPTCVPLRFGGAPEAPSMLEGLKESLRPMIMQLVQGAIKEALATAFGTTPVVPLLPPSDHTPAAEPKPKRQRNGKGKGFNATPGESGAPAEPSANNSKGSHGKTGRGNRVVLLQEPAGGAQADSKGIVRARPVVKVRRPNAKSQSRRPIRAAPRRQLPETRAGNVWVARRSPRRRNPFCSAPRIGMLPSLSLLRLAGP